MKRDQVVVIQATKTSSSLSNLQPMTTTNPQKQRKIINRLGGVKKGASTEFVEQGNNTLLAQGNHQHGRN